MMTRRLNGRLAAGLGLGLIISACAISACGNRLPHSDITSATAGDGVAAPGVPTAAAGGPASAGADAPVAPGSIQTTTIPGAPAAVSYTHLTLPTIYSV